jgi:hypothetical protein
VLKRLIRAALAELGPGFILRADANPLIEIPFRASDRRMVGFYHDLIWFQIRQFYGIHGYFANVQIDHPCFHYVPLVETLILIQDGL